MFTLAGKCALSLEIVKHQGTSLNLYFIFYIFRYENGRGDGEEEECSPRATVVTEISM